MSEAMQPPSYQGPAHEPAAIGLAVISGLAFLLVLQPFAWHAKQRNMPAASLILWLLILNLMNFTNAIIWPNDDVQSWFSGNVLCDIQVKVTVGSYAGINTALCAIARSLAMILDSRKVGIVPSAAQKRRETATQWILVWACPIYLMAIHYVVQPNRYFLFAISGCTPSFDNSWVTVVLVQIWPPFFALLSCFYAALLAWRLHKYRQEFSRIMTLNKTTKSRFIRLFALSTFLIIVFVPLSIWVLYTNLAAEYHPYSWSYVHSAFWPMVLPIPTDGIVLYDRWFRPAAAIVTFLFFGLGSDAISMYKGLLIKLGLGRVFPSLYIERTRGHSGFFPSRNSANSSLLKRFRNRHFSSKSRSAGDTAATDTSTLGRTSVSTSDLDTEKGFSKQPHSPTSPTSLPSPVRLAVDNGAVAVKTKVSVDEKQRYPGHGKSDWDA